MVLKQSTVQNFVVFQTNVLTQNKTKKKKKKKSYFNIIIAVKKKKKIFAKFQMTEKVIYKSVVCSPVQIFTVLIGTLNYNRRFEIKLNKYVSSLLI
jgi:hypothetical protein